MSFLLIFPEYESSQGPDKKRTVYQMALSKKSLSLLLWYCKRVFRYVKGTVFWGYLVCDCDFQQTDIAAS